MKYGVKDCKFVNEAAATKEDKRANYSSVSG